MDGKNLDILSNHEIQELNICQKNIELFNRYIADYEELGKRLETLPDRTRHEIMVPIGGTRLAFMPGYIHHTNEILVLLGENYFVEKSAKETIEFIGRRIEFCRQRLIELDRQKQMLRRWLETSTTMKEEYGQFFDITETCSEEEYQRMIKQRKPFREPDVKKPKLDLDSFFAKYQQDDDDEVRTTTPAPSTDSNKNIQQPFEVMERIPNQNPNPQSPEPVAFKRPVSKFKQSRQHQ